MTQKKAAIVISISSKELLRQKKESLYKDMRFKGAGRYIILKYSLKVYKTRTVITAGRKWQLRYHNGDFKQPLSNWHQRARLLLKLTCFGTARSPNQKQGSSLMSWENKSGWRAMLPAAWVWWPIFKHTEMGIYTLSTEQRESYTLTLMALSGTLCAYASIS